MAQCVDDMIAIDGKQSEVRGSGKWKQRAARQILRAAFSAPVRYLRGEVLAAQVKTSTKHVIDLVVISSATFARKQAAAEHIVQSPQLQ